MQVDTFASDGQILDELGARIKAARIRSGFTQERLAAESGVAKTTVERAEKGQSIQFLNVIKLLRALNALGGLDALLPSAEKTPLEYMRGTDVPLRVRGHKAAQAVPFKWGDEQ